MKRKTLAKLVTIVTIVVASTAGSSQKKYLPIAKSLESIKPNIPQRDVIPKLTVYNNTSVPSNYCGRYAVNISKKHYSKNFVRGNAWDMRYDNKIIKELGETPYKELDSLRMIGELDPGMIIGVNNPGSKQNGKKDKKGNIREYTHVITFIGKNKEGKLMYDHKWGKQTLRVNHKWMQEENLHPMEILGVKSG